MGLSRSVHLVAAGALVTPCIVFAAQQPNVNRPMTGIRIGQDAQMPALQRQILPDLAPATAPAERTDIDLEVVVGTAGTVLHARVVAPVADRLALEQALIEAVRRWEFRAAMDLGNRPQATLVVVRMSIEPPETPGGAPRVQGRLVEVGRVPVAAPVSANLPEPIYTPRTPGLRNPTLVRGIAPGYAGSAMRAKIQGAVILQAVILPDGTVGAARVVKSLHADLDREALIAARYWLFQPAMLGGRTVACVVTFEMEFRLH